MKRKIYQSGNVALLILLLAAAAGALLYVMLKNGSTAPSISSISPSTQVAQVSAPTSGLVAYYTFDSVSGTTVADASGNGNTLTLVGSPTQVTGIVGSGALSFNGTNQSAYIPSLNLSGTNAVSVSFWLNKQLSTNSVDALAFESSSDFNNSTTGFMTDFNDPICPAGHMSADLKGNVSPSYSVACYTRPSPNVWHHYVMIFNKSLSTNEVSVYIDGVLQTPITWPYNADNTNNFGTNPFYLMSRAGSSLYLAGALDDFRIYNRSITAAEVQSLYSLGTGGSSTPPPATTYTITVTKSGTGTGVITSSPVGIACSGSTCTQTVNAETSVTLTSTANSGSTFAGWGGACSGTSATCTLTVNSNVSVTETFNTSTVVDTTPPSVPTGLVSSNITQTGATISWTASTDASGIANYNVYRNGALVGSPTATTYTDSTLTSGATYSYTVSAIDASANANQSAQSAPLSVTTLQNTTPPVISSVSSSAITSSGATISWTTNENSNSQVVYGLTTAYGNNTALNSTLVTSHVVTLTGLAANTVYHYKVESTDASGNLASSADYTLTTSALSLSSSLVAYYTFDSVSGTTVADASGNGNTLTLVGSPTQVAGIVGSGALSFNGTNQSAYIPSLNLSGTNAVSVSFWLNQPTITNLGSDSLAFESSSNFNNSTTGFMGDLNSGVPCTSGQLYPGLRGNNSPYYSIACYTRPSPNVWHHYVMIFNKSLSTNEVSVYIDGVLQTPITWPYNADNTNNFGTNPFYLMSRAGSSLYLAGALDDFRIYNRSITAAEVQSLYSLGTGGSSTPPPATTYTITVTKSGTGTGVITSSPVGIACSGSTCTQTVNAETSVTLTSTANSGSTFAGWGGACSGTSATCTLTVNSNVSVTETFNTSTVVDTTPPSVPSSLTATAISSSQINLAWTASTDNVGVAGYNIYRGGTKVGTATTNSYSDTGLSASTAYTYTVSAYDAAGNVSQQSTSVSATTQAGTTVTGLIPSDRLPSTTANWNTAGVTGMLGSIPSSGWSVYKTLSPSGADDTAAILNAMNSAPAYSVVYLNPGNYNLSNFSQSFNKSYVVLRGAGPDKTILHFTAASRGISFGNDTAWPQYPANLMFGITSGATRGSTSLVSTGAASAHVGDLMNISELNMDGSAIAPAGTITVRGQGEPLASTAAGCSTPPAPTDALSCFHANPSADRDRNNTRNMMQMVRVTGINTTTNTITFSPALNWTLDPTLSPQIALAPSTIRQVGIEDLKVDNLNASSPPQDMVAFWFADQCWIKDVDLAHSEWAFLFYSTLNCEVRDSYIHNVFQDNYTVNNGYSEFQMSTAYRVENNIFNSMYAPFITEGGNSDSVVDYNYILDSHALSAGELASSINGNHGAHPMYNLSEGNVGSELQFDNYYGSSSHNTIFRNYFTGTDIGVSWDQAALKVDAQARYYNIIGNVLGTPQVSTGYTYPGTPTTWTYDPGKNANYLMPVIYRLGYAHIGNDGYDNFYDPNVKATALRGGNYDYATHSVIWNNNVPANEDATTYLSSQALPASLSLSSKPTWFGTTPFPAIGPDVSGGAGDQSGHVNIIPAERCFTSLGLNSNALGSFNANTCYYTGSTVTTPPPSDTTPPSIPSSLTATAISSSQINLAWTASTDNVGVAGYYIYRNGGTTPVATVTTTSYSDTGLTASTAYSYAVAAFDAAGNISAQSIISATTLAVATPPSTTFTVGQGVQVYNVGTTGLSVRNSPSATAATVTGSPVANGTTGTITTAPAGTINGTSNGGYYWWYVTYSNGVVGWSAETYLQAYTAPTTYTISASSSGTGSGTISCVVSGSTNSCTSPVASGTSLTMTATPSSGSTFVSWSSTPTGVCSGTSSTCTATITANTTVNATFNTSTVVDTTPPSIPSSLTATAISSSQINLAWTASTDNVGVAGYYIYRGGTKVGTATTNSYSDTGLSASTAYTYTVSAYDAAGNVSQQSTSVSATTQATVVTPPPSGSVIPSANQVNWNSTGVSGTVGGMPDASWSVCTTTACNKLAAGPSGGDDALNYASAISSAPANSIIMLGAGNYKFETEQKVYYQSNFAIRGAGPDKTTITYSGGGEGPFTFGVEDSYTAPTSAQIMNITSGYTKGSTSMNVSSVGTGAAVGNLMLIDELNDSSIPVNPVSSEGSSASNLAESDRDHNNTRNLQQIVKITQISGDTITFTPALYWTYSSSLQPQAEALAGTLHNIGLEDLRVVNDGTQYDISFWNTDQCWVRDVETGPSDWHVFLWKTLNCEVRDSYFFGAFGGKYVVNRGIGIQADYSSNARIENNIFGPVRTATFMTAGTSGSVVGYNYMFNNKDDSSPGQLLTTIDGNHGSHPSFDLTEGNVVGEIQPDDYYGSSSHGTIFRNWALGTDIGITFDRKPISIDRNQHYYAIVGNVLGTSALSGWSYQATPTSVPDPVIYRLGYAHIGNNNTDQYDSGVISTLTRQANYDYYHNCVWSDSTNSCMNSTQVAAVGLPSSLYLSSRPSWFNTPWSSVSFPAIGPDVTGGTADSSGHVNEIPAQLCYLNTVAVNGTFNAHNCYGN